MRIRRESQCKPRESAWESPCHYPQIIGELPDAGFRHVIRIDLFPTVFTLLWNLLLGDYSQPGFVAHPMQSFRPYGGSHPATAHVATTQEPLLWVAVEPATKYVDESLCLCRPPCSAQGWKQKVLCLPPVVPETSLSPLGEVVFSFTLLVWRVVVDYGIL